MKERISAWIAPVSQDPDLARREYMLNIALLGLISTGSLFTLATAVLWLLGKTNAVGPVIGLGILPVYAWAYFLNRRGRTRVAVYFPVVALFLSMVGANIQVGVGHSPLIGYAMVTSLAGVLIGIKSALSFALLSTLAYVIIGTAQASGWLPGAIPPGATIVADGVAIGGGLMVLVILDWLSNREIGRALQKERQLVEELQAHQTQLEQRIAERTRGLQAAAEVSRATISVLDPDTLLRQTVNLVRERFDLYYVGLFLLDEERRFAVLRAGTGEAGRQMLEQGHRLEVGGESMIGQCTATGQARIALDVGEEAARFDNPMLPETRSEMALPLRSRGRVIGAMSVQSDKGAAFDESDIAVMQTMADQVAVAIDNARLFAEAQAALREMEAAHRHYLDQAWSEYVRTAAETSLEIARPGVAPLGDAVLPEIRQAVEQRSTKVLGGKDAEGEADHSALITPIALRGTIIGALGICDDDGTREWTEDEIALVEAVAERMALAADNLRLLRDTQKTLGETEALYDASRAIGAATTPEEVRQALVDYAATSGVDAARILFFEYDERSPAKPGRGLRGQPSCLVMYEGWTVDNRPAQPVGTRLSMEDYPLAAFMDSGEPIVVEDVLTDPRANEATRTLVVTISGLRSFVIVPIVVGERRIGAIFIGRNKPSTFEEEFIRGYWTLASQAAIALESMRLLEETRRRAEREQLVGEATARMRETLDLEAVLKAATGEMRRVLGLDKIVIRLVTPETDGDSA